MEEARVDLEELRRRLGPKRTRFCEEYLQSEWNGTEAAVRAGYGKTRRAAAVTATRLLRSEDVQAYLQARSREIYRQLGMTPERVTAEMVRLYRRATSAEPVLAWDSEKKAYVETGQWQYDAKTAVRLLESLGQHAGMFVQRVEQTQTVRGPLEGLSTEELRSLLRLSEDGGTPTPQSELRSDSSPCTGEPWDGDAPTPQSPPAAATAPLAQGSLETGSLGTETEGE